MSICYLSANFCGDIEGSAVCLSSSRTVDPWAREEVAMYNKKKKKDKPCLRIRTFKGDFI